MIKAFLHPVVLACWLALASWAPAQGQIKLRTEQIFDKLSVGYATRLVDMNEDGRADVVVVDTDRVVWFENPTWQMHTLVEHATKQDNVSIAPYDIDGDGKVDFALAADWRPSDTRTSGTLQWLSRGKTLAEPWAVHPIGTEPTTHRIRFADFDGDGRDELIVVPLFGRNTKGPDYAEAPIRILSYQIPRDPLGPWQSQVINEELHVAHNFLPVDLDHDGKLDMVVASFEGLSLLKRDASGAWHRTLIGSGNQQTSPSRGASEIRYGRLASGADYLATIEPWHGFQVVVYTRPLSSGASSQPALWQRTVIDEQLKWGHALWCVDLDADGDEELIVGVRDTKDAANPCGLRIYDPAGADPANWKQQRIDPAGVAIEDLVAGDLNADGKIDVVAVGRQTKNVRIYWNETPAAVVQTPTVGGQGAWPSDTLPDSAGGERPLALLRGRVATVLVCLGVECPVSREYTATLNQLAADFPAPGVQFVGLDPNENESLESMRDFARDAHLAFPFLRDPGGKVARRMRFKVSPEVRLFDAGGKLVYRGRIDDRYRAGAAGKASTADLQQALAETLAGKPVSKAQTKPVGCPLQLGPAR